MLSAQSEKCQGFGDGVPKIFRRVQLHLPFQGAQERDELRVLWACR